MNTSKRYNTLGLAFLLTAALVGCEREAGTPEYETSAMQGTQAETEQSEAQNAQAEMSGQQNTGQNSAPMDDTEYESDLAHEGAEQYDADATDAITEHQPVMPNAHYEDLNFARGSTTLSAEAEEKLTDLAEDIEQGKQVYLTIRVEDDDTIESTAPEGDLNAMAQPRAESIKSFLQNQGLNIAKVGIDQTGTVANYGEDNAIARPDATTPNESAASSQTQSVDKDDMEYVVITISEGEEMYLGDISGMMYAGTFSYQ